MPDCCGLLLHGKMEILEDIVLLTLDGVLLSLVELVKELRFALNPALLLVKQIVTTAKMFPSESSTENDPYDMINLVIWV